MAEQVDLELTREQIMQIEDVSQRLDALERFHRIQDNERTQQVADISRNLSLTNQTLCVSQAATHIPFFKGDDGPINDFLQDIENGRSLITPAQEQIYLRIVISRLKGKARDCLKGHTFNNLDELKTHLKAKFSPFKSYGHYVNKISKAVMKEGENARDFHGRLTHLVTLACNASKFTPQGTPLENPPDPKAQLEMLALEAFLIGVPDQWQSAMIQASPKTFQEALESAAKIEHYHSLLHKNPTSNKTVNVALAQRSTDNRNNSGNYVKKQVTFDPTTHDRNAIPFVLNGNDTICTPTTIDKDGRIVAHPLLSYLPVTATPTEHNPTAILKRPSTPPSGNVTPSPNNVTWPNGNQLAFLPYMTNPFFNPMMANAYANMQLLSYMNPFLFNQVDSSNTQQSQQTNRSDSPKQKNWQNAPHQDAARSNQSNSRPPRSPNHAVNAIIAQETTNESTESNPQGSHQQ